MKFTKMHGAGNDYVYVDCFREKVNNPSELAIRVSDRHKGIGSDGLVLIMPSETSDFQMRMFNLDGSEAQMCGNATRCVGKYVYDNGYTDQTTVTLETKAGEKILELFPVNGKVERVTVDMGEPVLKVQEVPVRWNEERLISREIDFEPEKLAVTAVSMGNPHAVIFMSDIDRLEIEKIGRKIENHPMFPEKTNVEFVEVISPNHAKMRVWERGSGETQACGTGACATLVAAVLNRQLDRKAIISLLGGDLELFWNPDNNHVMMTGPAETVFVGEI
ncbi:MAG: Diaminopimelate epimerase [Candidatus Ordinivivax streblomastigis]|uniref:Diaminopimelate epimerase n=1 Tax=Candidatus Ordinivivax streblomastigis TaxID=2540710 RepID=A0A5M8NZW7_9BACT|nr:MAG: Diaminopimelate epimerase [Candidatus Ordinivivax streblomastigis]